MDIRMYLAGGSKPKPAETKPIKLEDSDDDEQVILSSGIKRKADQTSNRSARGSASEKDGEVAKQTKKPRRVDADVVDLSDGGADESQKKANDGKSRKEETKIAKDVLSAVQISSAAGSGTTSKQQQASKSVAVSSSPISSKPSPTTPIQTIDAASFFSSVPIKAQTFLNQSSSASRSTSSYFAGPAVNASPSLAPLAAPQQPTQEREKSASEAKSEKEKKPHVSSPSRKATSRVEDDRELRQRQDNNDSSHSALRGAAAAATDDDDPKSEFQHASPRKMAKDVSSSVKSPAAKSPAKSPSKLVTSSSTSLTASPAVPVPPASSAALTPAQAGGGRKMPAWLASKDRGPPPKAGQKPVPVGAPGCLSYGGGGPASQAKHGLGRSNPHPLTFVLSGVLESLERGQAEDLIKRYGGKVTGAVSGRTDYLVLGSDGGEKKRADAEAKGVKVIDEDGLFEVVKSRSPGVSSTLSGAGASSTPSPSSAAYSTADVPSAQRTPLTLQPQRDGAGTHVQGPPASSGSVGARAPAGTAGAKGAQLSTVALRPGSDELWVDKYKPKRIEEIVGNPSSVQEIVRFLQTWHKTFLSSNGDAPASGSGKGGSAASKFGAKRAILLSGPPGIGKSTAAALCAQHAGFEVLEFNASDTRNKASIREEVGSALDNHALSEYFVSANSTKSGGPGPAAASKAVRGKQKLVVVMDEVDGVTANDRGGIGELIACIKTTKTPIICICNDASSVKIRSLKNYTNNITWRRPTAQQMVPRLAEIARRENMQVDPVALEQLVSSVHSDMRQALNTLQMWSHSRGHIDYDTAKKRIESGGKDFDSTPFDVAPAFFRRPDSRDWINDRINKYFVSADMLPLFVQENYLSARVGLNPSSNVPLEVQALSLYAQAADAIAEGDLISEALRSEQNWALMPMHGVMSTVMPGAYCGGGATGMLAFPSLLGRLSTTNKNLRQVQQMKCVLSLDTDMSSTPLALEYLPLLRKMLLKPLVTSEQDGLDTVLKVLEDYGLTRDDWDIIMELGDQFSDLKAQQLDSKVKAAFTRAVKKDNIAIKVSRTAVSKTAKAVRSRGVRTEEEEEQDAEHELEGDDDENGDEDEKKEDLGPMVQMVKPRGGANKKGATTTSSTASKKKTAPKSKKPISDDDDDD